jgi:arginase family enzyme
VKTKPSVPIGKMGVDAFGRRPVFEDKGDRLRGILNIGREDVTVEGLLPVDPGVAVLGASSDHLVVDLTEAAPRRVGDRLGFCMSYGALLAAMTSEYVEKQPMLDPATPRHAARVRLLPEPDLRDFVTGQRLEARLAALGLQAAAVDAGDEAVVADEVAAAVGAEAVPLLLGADHRISLAGLRGVARAVDAFGLLWFDATAGFQPPGDGQGDAETVLTRALGYDPAVPAVKPQLSPENVVLIGLRDAAPREAELIKGSRVSVFTIADIDALGIREVMRQALQAALAGTRGLYVSYCPAATDLPGVAGGAGGITLRETHQAMEIIAQAKALLAMDAIGLGPGREPRLLEETANFIMSCFGKQIL